MNIYLFAIASLIFVVPLVYFLPLGLTRKGKLLIITVSFVLSLVGLSANAMFEWWKLSLLVVILVILSSYLLDKKMNRLILISTNEDSKSLIETQANFFDEELEEYRDKTEEPKQINLNEENNAFFEEDISELQVDKPADRIDENDEINPKVEDDEAYDPSIDLFMKTDINKNEQLADELVNMDNEEVDEKPQELDGNPEIGYMSELEKLIFDIPEAPLHNTNISDEIVEHSTRIVNEFEGNSQEYDDEYLEVLTHFEDEEGQAIKRIELLEETPAIENLEEIGEESSESREELLGILTQFESAEKEAASTIEQVLEEEQAIERIEANRNEELISDTYILPMDIDSLNIHADNEKNHLQRQMFQTIISQVKLAQKSLASHKYEQLLEECMHPEMPYSEYFTLAGILIQHYISTKNYLKLQELLLSLEEKYDNYPILLQQVQFLLTYYQKNFGEK